MMPRSRLSLTTPAHALCSNISPTSSIPACILCRSMFLASSRHSEEIQGFTYYDTEKGWPLATGPYKIVEWSPSQKFIDRRDDWWAAKTGFAELPVIERILMIPATDDTRLVQLIVNNEIDSSLGLACQHDSADLPESQCDHPYGPGTALRLRRLVAHFHVVQL